MDVETLSAAGSLTHSKTKNVFMSYKISNKTI